MASDLGEIESAVSGNSTDSRPANEASQRSFSDSSETLSPTRTSSGCIEFKRWKGRFYPTESSVLKNSLLAGVGYLELANGGDFAANVWNTIPVPIYAIVFMAVGGTFALCMSVVAFQDARLSWRNIRLLRQERHLLQTYKARHVADKSARVDIHALLDVNFREIGTEVVDRIGMDTLLGFGTILVGIGTLMAIGGANPRVFHASNLLSGYIGNAPALLYGMVNAAWSVFVWNRARQHKVAGSERLEDGRLEKLLKSRNHSIQGHAILSGITGLLAGVASMITATRWWGYTILLPCVFSSIFCNYFWRHRLGYDRPLFRDMETLERACLVDELKSVVIIRDMFKPCSEKLGQPFFDPQSLKSVVEFLLRNHLFEQFCMRLLSHPFLSPKLFDDATEVTIEVHELLTVNDGLLSSILEVAKGFMNQKGPLHFTYLERYLLEVYGCLLISKAELSH
jgi:hypothetical protein